MAERVHEFTRTWLRRVEVGLDQIIDVRIDHTNVMLGRIERRLDLSEAGAVR